MIAMRKILFILATATMVLQAKSQQTIHDANAQKRNVSGYHGIKVSDGIDLYLSEGEESVAISAGQDKFRDRIRTEVKDGILHIWYDHEKNNRMIEVEWGNRKMKAYVSYKQLDQLAAGGGSDILVQGTLKTASLSLNISGGSDFKGDVQASDMKIDASGGSDVVISGKVTRLVADASGGSDFKGYELVTDNCELNCSGGSDVYITVNNELKAEASGGSDIYYKGNAVIREIKSSGSSSIKKATR